MTPQTTSIQAVLFDYGMVLSGPPAPKAWQRIRSISGLSEDALHAAYWTHRQAYDRGTFDAVAYWQAVAAHANFPSFTPDQLSSLIAADIDLWGETNQPMLDWAQALQKAGVRTGILSNIGDAMTEGILARFDWISGFDHCTWSYELKLAKPEAEIYRCAAEGLRTPPANILFIDDKAENIEAARGVGLAAIQYTDHKSFEREMEERGFGHLLRPSSVAAGS